MNPAHSHRPFARKAAAILAALATSAAMLSAGVSGATAATAAADPSSDQVVLNVLGINDFHGRINDDTVKFAGTIEELRQEGGEANTLFISAGDNIGASVFASASQDDKPTIDVLNAMGLQASAVGNHELDKGIDDLTGRVQDAANYDYLAANIYAKDTTDPVLDTYKTYDVDGVSVAVIGAVTQEAPTLVTPAGIANLDFGDPVDAVNRVAKKLESSATPPDVIVATYHEGASEGTPDGATLEEEVANGGAFAKIVQQTDPDIDAIFTGHTHKAYSWDAPVPGTNHNRPILQTGSYGERVGQVKLTFDTSEDEVVSYTAKNVDRTTTDDATLINDYPRVKEVDSIVDAALEEAEVIGGQPVGSVKADITTAYTDSDDDGVLDSRDDRSSESTLGDLVADALTESVGDTPAGADFGVVNPGGLRAELLYAGSTGKDADVNSDGVITYAEANAVLPFVNNLYSVALTGARFKKVLEQQWQTSTDGTKPSRPYLQLGLSRNVTYTYDADREAGDRITSVFINNEPLDPAKTYKVATFSFLATGGDNFRAFTEGTSTDTGLVDRDAWIAYLGEHENLAPNFARRAIALKGQKDSYEAGETVSLSLSKLDLTSLGSPKNKTVTATLGDTSQEFPVTDGAAQVEFTIPSGTSGDQMLKLTADPTGTSVDVPLTIESSKSETSITASTHKYYFGLHTVNAKITSPDGKPSGAVAVYSGKKIVSLGFAYRGHAIAPLFGPRPGTELTVKYLGTKKYSPSSTTVVIPN